MANNGLFTFGRRVCYATTIAVVTWLLSNRGGLALLLGRVLDFPVAVATAVSGGFVWLKGIDLFFDRGVGEFMTRDSILLWHLRASLFVYVPLFYAAALAINVWKRRGKAAESTKGQR